MEKYPSNIPKSPGVYRFLDESGSVLYIGKAKNLNNRIKQYFQKELKRGPAIDQMVALAKEIRWVETDSEIEAVLLEAELINKLKPKYNIRSKDDKSFLVIRIEKNRTLGSQKTDQTKKLLNKFPFVELIRFKNVDLKDRSADYFGPYPAGLLLKKSLRYLRKIFPFRDCSPSKFHNYQKKGRSCIYGDIGLCPAPCTSDEMEEYARNILYLKNFLKGRKKAVIKALEKEMGRSSRKQEFEEAKDFRDKIQALNHLNEVAIGLKDEPFDANNLLFKRIECFDISNIGNQYAVGSMVVLNNGKPAKSEYRRFRVKSEKLKVESDLERLQQVLERRFKNDWPLPNLIVIDGGELQLRVAKEALLRFNLNVPIISIAKGVKRKKNEFHFSDSAIAKYAAGNTVLIKAVIMARDEAHRFAISYYRKLHIKGMLNG